MLPRYEKSDTVTLKGIESILEDFQNASGEVIEELKRGAENNTVYEVISEGMLGIDAVYFDIQNIDTGLIIERINSDNLIPTWNTLHIMTGNFGDDLFWEDTKRRPEKKPE